MQHGGFSHPLTGILPIQVTQGRFISELACQAMNTVKETDVLLVLSGCVWNLESCGVRMAWLSNSCAEQIAEKKNKNH